MREKEHPIWGAPFHLQSIVSELSAPAASTALIFLSALPFSMKGSELWDEINPFLHMETLSSAFGRDILLQ